MKAYFTASIYHRKDLLAEYKKIISCLKELGVEEVFSEDIVDIPLDEALNESEIERKKWHTTWSNYIQKCDFVIAEISYPSTINVGFEINNILERGKPVIGLYKQGRDPIFLSELHSKRFIKSSYTEDSLKSVLKWALEEVRVIINKRFTFIVPPDIAHFLENSYENFGVNASDLIRELLRRERRKIQRKANKKRLKK